MGPLRLPHRFKYVIMCSLTAKILIGLIKINNKIYFSWPNSSLRVYMKVFSRLLSAISVLLDTVLQCYMPQMAAYPRSVIRAPGSIKSKKSYVSFSAQKLSK